MKSIHSEIFNPIGSRSCSCLILVVLLITPPPVDHVEWEQSDPSRPVGGRHNDLVAPYAQVVREIGAEMNVDVLDLWKEGSPYRVENGDFCGDGLHMGTGGNRKIFQGLVNIIQTRHPHLNDFNVELHYPDWKELKGKSVEESKTMLETWVWSTRNKVCDL